MSGICLVPPAHSGYALAKSMAKLKQKLNRCLQILFGFFDGFTLSVGARDLQADRPEASLRSRLNHGGQLPLHETSP